jgi:hypothetical protein
VTNIIDMGLVFALQPDLRHSAPEKLILRSAKKRFALGGTFLFTATLVGTMVTAAFPIFKLFWAEGEILDRAITLAIATIVVAYPLAALWCWLYDDVVIFTRERSGTYSVESFRKILDFCWDRHTVLNTSLENLRAENYKDSLNQAAIDAKKGGIQNRYATKGHWTLRVLNENKKLSPCLERRAKKEEIDFLIEQIKTYFIEVKNSTLKNSSESHLE